MVFGVLARHRLAALRDDGSSIFKHLFTTLPQFGLRPFQRPLSVDIGDPLQTGAA